MISLDPKVIGENVLRLRKYRGFSQHQLSQRCDLGQSVIADLESGTSNPTLKTLNAVARGLSVDPAFLVFGLLAGVALNAVNLEPEVIA